MLSPMRALLRLAADVEMAYSNLVGLLQVAAMHLPVASAAQTAAARAQCFVDAGNPVRYRGAAPATSAPAPAMPGMSDGPHDG